MFLLKYKYLALTSLSLVLAGVFAQPSQATKAIYPKTRPLLLSYKQLQQLPKPARNEYIRSISKELVIISQLSKKRRKLNTTASWLFELLIETAQANQSIRGLCGGVFDRVNTAGGSCGVNSYAGFTCANPEHEICKPLIIGVLRMPQLTYAFKEHVRGLEAIRHSTQSLQLKPTNKSGKPSDKTTQAFALIKIGAQSQSAGPLL